MSSMIKTPLFDEAKAWARENDLEVTFEDYEEHEPKVADLSKYRHRRFRTAFEFWITRERN